MNKKGRQTALINACLILMVALFSLDLYNPSLPAMMKSLQVSYSLIRAITVVFLIGLALSQLFFGPLSDRFGRKPTTLAALALLMMANLSTAMAENITQMLVLRFIAGC